MSRHVPRFVQFTIGLLVGCAVLGGSQTRAQQVIRWKFKEGETLNNGMTKDMSMKMRIQNMPIDQKMTQTMDMRWIVGKVDTDGAAKMVQVIDRVRFTMEAPPPVGKITID